MGRLRKQLLAPSVLGAWLCVFACQVEQSPGFLLRPPAPGRCRAWGVRCATQGRQGTRLLAQPEERDGASNATEAYSLDPVQGFVALETRWAIDSANEVCDVEVDLNTCGEVCDACDGMGEVECRVCFGTGFFSIGDQLMERGTPCPVCQGTGLEPCKKCQGTGMVAHWMKRVLEISGVEEDNEDKDNGDGGRRWM